VVHNDASLTRSRQLTMRPKITGRPGPGRPTVVIHCAMHKPIVPRVMDGANSSASQPHAMINTVGVHALGAAVIAMYRAGLSVSEASL